MKKNYLILLIVFCTFFTQAQIIDFPDPAFKNKLLTYPSPIDLNNDNEIDVSEAEQVTELVFSFCNFNNVTGIEYFVNLETLSFGSYTSITTTVDLSGLSNLKSLHFTKCTFPAIDFGGLGNLENFSIGYGGNFSFLNFNETVRLKSVNFYNTHFTSIDLSHAPNMRTFSAQNTDLTSVVLTGLTNLRSFKCTNSGDLTSLDLTDLTNLEYFEVQDNNLTNLDFQNNLELEQIKCGSNALTTLDVSFLTRLKHLSCNSNQLTELYIGNNERLEWLSCGENLLTAIDLSQSHKLKYLDASFNLFTTLDLSGMTDCDDNDPVPGYYINNNPNLVSVNLKNGKKDYAWTNNLLNCPNLIYMCLDEMDMFDQGQILQANGITTIQINTYCSFVPGGDYNTITGTFSLDYDNNGCDDNDYKWQSGRLGFTHNDESGTTHTDAQGKYNFYVQAGEYTLTPELENDYFTVSPASIILNFDDNQNQTQTQHFCLVPNGIHKDLEIILIPTQAASPGSNAPYRLIYKNKGNQILSGNIKVEFDNDALDFVSAVPEVSEQTNQELSWVYGTLKPFETRAIDFALNVSAAANPDAVLHFTASIDPVAEDETTADNSIAIAQTVVGSAVANDKICLEGATITPELVGDYVHYAIRFQNSGTAIAKNVVVKDLIDTDKFEMDSLQFTSASHATATKITGNVVEFQFENINLATQTDNDAASRGYVAFKIKTKNQLVIDDSFSNKADIYFDYNFPTETNTALTTVTALLGNSTFENATVTVTPNPTKNKVHITSKGNITSVQLYDLQGRLLETMTAGNEQLDFDLSQKAFGIYFVKVNTAKGIKVAKIIKE